MRLLNASGALNLNIGAQRQFLDANASACLHKLDHERHLLNSCCTYWLLVSQESNIHLIHCTKVGHVGEVNVELDDIIETAAGSLEHGLEVVHDLFLEGYMID